MLTHPQARAIAKSQWGAVNASVKVLTHRGAFYFSCASHGGFVIDARTFTEEQRKRLEEFATIEIATTHRSPKDGTVFNHPYRQRAARVASRWPVDTIPFFLFEEDQAWCLPVHLCGLRLAGMSEADIESARETWERLYDPQNPMVQHHKEIEERRKARDPDMILSAQGEGRDRTRVRTADGKEWIVSDYQNARDAAGDFWLSRCSIVEEVLAKDPTDTPKSDPALFPAGLDEVDLVLAHQGLVVDAGRLLAMHGLRPRDIVVQQDLPLQDGAAEIAERCARDLCAKTRRPALAIIDGIRLDLLGGAPGAMVANWARDAHGHPPAGEAERDARIFGQLLEIAREETPMAETAAASLIVAVSLMIPDAASTRQRESLVPGAFRLDADPALGLGKAFVPVREENHIPGHSPSALGFLMRDLARERAEIQAGKDIA